MNLVCDLVCNKLQQVLLELESNAFLSMAGLNANSVHPGGIMTNLARHMDEDSMKAMNTDQLLKDLKSPAQGAYFHSTPWPLSWIEKVN
jgi:hypothetical protein